jgi:hypothetical protein
MRNCRTLASRRHAVCYTQKRQRMTETNDQRLMRRATRRFCFLRGRDLELVNRYLDPSVSMGRFSRLEFGGERTL